MSYENDKDIKGDNFKQTTQYNPRSKPFQPNQKLFQPGPAYKDVKPNKNDIDKLFTSITEGNLDKVKDVILEFNLPLTVKNSDGETLIHKVMKIERMSIVDKIQLIKYLLLNGSAISSDNFGMTPIHIGAKYQNYKFIKEFINKQNVNTLDNKNMNALHYFATGNKVDCNDIDVNQTKLKSIIVGNPIKVCSINKGILTLYNDDYLNVTQNTCETCYSFDMRIIDMLIYYGININQQDIAGHTPIYYSINMYNSFLTDRLLEKGSFVVNVENNSGWTPLEYTAKLLQKHIRFFDKISLHRNLVLKTLDITNSESLPMFIPNIIAFQHLIMESIAYDKLTPNIKQTLLYELYINNETITEVVNNYDLYLSTLQKLGLANDDNIINKSTEFLNNHVKHSNILSSISYRYTSLVYGCYNTLFESRNPVLFTQFQNIQLQNIVNGIFMIKTLTNYDEINKLINTLQNYIDQVNKYELFIEMLHDINIEDIKKILKKIIFGNFLQSIYVLYLQNTESTSDNLSKIIDNIKNIVNMNEDININEKLIDDFNIPFEQPSETIMMIEQLKKYYKNLIKKLIPLIHNYPNIYKNYCRNINYLLKIIKTLMHYAKKEYINIHNKN